MAINPGFKSHDFQQNKFDFYSGSQITVWIGNIMIDDIVSIQWTRSQGKKPIYGYASQQFDAVAKGIVLIQGNFVVNFRQAGYIAMVMSEIQKIYGETTDKQSLSTVNNLIGLHLRNGTFGPKTSQELIDLGNSPDFGILANEYSRIMWGPGPEDKIDSPSTGISVSSPYSADVQQQINLKDGFTIQITYGNTSGASSNTLNDYMQSTTKTLVGVHLVGESQGIVVGGQPTMEQYDFIARGSDEQLGNER